MAEITVSSSSDRPRVSSRSQVRARQLLPGIDGRSAWTRRAAALIREHLADLGGVENCSVAERNLVRRAAVLTTELERMEVGFALAGEASVADLEVYQRTGGNLRRLLEAVGLQRRARTIEPSLSDILNEEAAE